MTPTGWKFFGNLMDSGDEKLSPQRPWFSWVPPLGWCGGLEDTPFKGDYYRSDVEILWDFWEKNFFQILFGGTLVTVFLLGRHAFHFWNWLLECSKLHWIWFTHWPGSISLTPTTTPLSCVEKKALEPALTTFERRMVCGRSLVGLKLPKLGVPNKSDMILIDFVVWVRLLAVQLR